MNYDLILNSFDAGMVSEAAAAAQRGEYVGCILNASHDYSEEEYVLSLGHVLEDISYNRFQLFPEKTKSNTRNFKQLLWKHMHNQVQLRLAEQRAEQVEFLELMGVFMLEGKASEEAHVFEIKCEHLKYLVSTQEVLSSKTAPTTRLTHLPKYVEQVTGFRELLQRKSAPRQILVNQTGLESEHGMGLSLMQELANILDLEIYDLDLVDGAMQFGITLDGKVRIKNGILKNVTFDLLWHPSAVENVFPMNSWEYEERCIAYPFTGV